MAEAYLEIFHESFARVSEAEHFFEDFYKTFLGSSEVIAEKFKNTDIVTQSRMLALSLIHMVAYAISGEPNATLQRLAEIHSKAGQDIEPALYDKWMDALMATVAKHDDQWSEQLEAAWRRVLAPGIAYMKDHYDP